MTPQIYSYLYHQVKRFGKTAKDNGEVLHLIQDLLEREREGKILNTRVSHNVLSLTNYTNPI